MSKQWNWKLNEALLTDEKFKQTIREELEFNFLTNCIPDVAPYNIWEAQKSYIRGILI